MNFFFFFWGMKINNILFFWSITANQYWNLNSAKANDVWREGGDIVGKIGCPAPDGNGDPDAIEG